MFLLQHFVPNTFWSNAAHVRELLQEWPELNGLLPGDPQGQPGAVQVPANFPGADPRHSVGRSTALAPDTPKWRGRRNNGTDWNPQFPGEVCDRLERALRNAEAGNTFEIPVANGWANVPAVADRKVRVELRANGDIVAKQTGSGRNPAEVVRHW